MNLPFLNQPHLIQPAPTLTPPSWAGYTGGPCKICTHHGGAEHAVLDVFMVTESRFVSVIEMMLASNILKTNKNIYSRSTYLKNAISLHFVLKLVLKNI